MLPIIMAAQINHETYITINSLTIFKRKMRNLRINLIYLSFFCSVYYKNEFCVKCSSSTSSAFGNISLCSTAAMVMVKFDR